MKKLVRRVLLACLVVSGLGAFVLATGFAPPPARQLSIESVVTPTPPPPEPARRGWVGVLLAERAADIRAPIAGTVAEMSVALSEPVREGQTLFRIDAQRLGLEKAVAEHAEQGRRAEFESALAAWQAAKATRARLEPLVERQLVSPAEYEVAETNAVRAGIAVAAARAALGKQQAEVATLTFDRDATTIEAPFSGVVVGHFCVTGERVDAQAPCLRIANLDRLFVRIGIPEEAASTVRVGDVLTARRLRGGSPDERLRLRVERVSAELDVMARLAVAEATLLDVPPGLPAGATLEIDPSHSERGAESRP